MEVGKLQSGRFWYVLSIEKEKKTHLRKICVQGGSLMNFLRL